MNGSCTLRRSKIRTHVAVVPALVLAAIVSAAAQQPGTPAAPVTSLPAAPSAVLPNQVVTPGTAPNTNASGLTVVAAVQRALDQNPSLHLQQHTVDYYRGALDVQKGTFDTTVSANTDSASTKTPLTKAAIAQAAQAGINTRAQDVLSTDTSLSVSKLFRNGISISPNLSVSRSSDNLGSPVGSATSLGAVQLTIPLLRNRGRATVDAQENAAKLELTAQGLQLAQVASTTIAQTVNAYWNYEGALLSLDAYRQSELRGQELLDNTRIMIAADQIPRAEINFATANLASRTATRAAAEQNVVVAAQALAGAIGVPADQVLSIPAPSDPLPQLTTDADLPITPPALLSYVQEGLQDRGDYLATTVRIKEADTLRIGARGQLRPQLDAGLSAGYAGLQENGSLEKYFGSVIQNTVGPTLSGSLRYSYPINNHFYRGQYEQADASLKQSRDNQVLVGNGIATGIVSAANGLNTSATQLRTATLATQTYRLALEGERERLRFGQSSLLNILESEDRYISAQLSEISAQVAYANAIANFRYSTGTYVNVNQPNQIISADAFYRAQTAAAPVPGPPGVKVP